MPLMIPMAYLTTNKILTIDSLVKTKSLTPLPTITSDATTAIPTGYYPMTIEMNSTMPPLKTLSHATNSILTRSSLPMKIITHPTSSTIATTTIMNIIPNKVC